MSVSLTLPEDLELLALKVAREIAMDLYEIDDILKNNSISAETYEKLTRNPYFQKLVEQAIAEWKSSPNTAERVKFKAAAQVEEWLKEANAMAHDRSQPLSARVELMKLVKTLAGVGERGPLEGSGERFSVTINLGAADTKLRFEKLVEPKQIEGEVLPPQEK